MKKIILIVVLIFSFQNNLLAENFNKFNQWLLENGHSQYLKNFNKFLSNNTKFISENGIKGLKFINICKEEKKLLILELLKFFSLSFKQFI